MPDYKIYAAVNSIYIHHSSLSNGKPIIGAGNFVLTNGKISRLFLNSGHYLPGINQYKETILAFEQSKLPLPNDLSVKYYLESEIALIKPKVICIMGNTAYHSILGGSNISQNRGKTIKKDGHLVLVVPSLESALFSDFRQIESNLRSGLKPSAAVNADFQTRKSLRNSDGLFVPLRDGELDRPERPVRHRLWQ